MEMVIRGGKIFDAIHREPYSADIWVKDGKIAQIGGDFAASADAEAVDASGLNVYPGMVEAHGHIGLDGWAIGYEGQDYPIGAGENFRFAKGGLHSVTANGKFKMALLLTLK